MMARTPDLSCIWSELTSNPKRESISSWFSTRSAAPSEPLSAARAAAILGSSLSSAIFYSLYVAALSARGLLNDHLFQQHVAHMIGRGRDIDPAQQLFLQPQHPGRAFEIVQAKL